MIRQRLGLIAGPGRWPEQRAGWALWGSTGALALVGLGLGLWLSWPSAQQGPVALAGGLGDGDRSAALVDPVIVKAGSTWGRREAPYRPALADTRSAPGCELSPAEDTAQAPGLTADWHRRHRQQAQQARLATQSALLDAADDLPRAVGLRLLASYFGEADPDPGCGAQACQGDGELQPRSGADPADVKAAAVIELQALAQRSQRAAIQGLAWQACQQLSAPAAGSALQRDAAQACAGQSLRRWAGLDPGNALPWLLLAEQARSQADLSDEAFAMARAADAPRFRSDDGELMHQVVAQLPASAPDWVRLEVQVVALGLGFVPAQPALAQLLAYCPESGTALDAAQAQRCSALASLMIERGSTLIDLGAGIRLAERSGWPADRLSRARVDYERLLTDAGAWSLQSALAATTDCAALGLMQRELAAIGQEGELAVLRRRQRPG